MPQCTTAFRERMPECTTVFRDAQMTLHVFRDAQIKNQTHTYLGTPKSDVALGLAEAVFTNSMASVSGTMASSDPWTTATGPDDRPRIESL